MKYLPYSRFAGLAVLLVLAACATQSPAPVSESSAKADKPVAAGSSSTSAPPPAPVASVIPGGDLKPIASVDSSPRQVTLLLPPTDLWERMRRGFKMADLQSDYVRQQEQVYLQRPDYIARMTERSRKYLFHIVEELERRDMPTELALLPF